MRETQRREYRRVNKGVVKFTAAYNGSFNFESTFAATRTMPAPLLVINIAGLGFTSINETNTPNLAKLAAGGSISSVQPPVPALTSPSQATILTGSLPIDHGIVANGWYFRDLALILNWQRSARLVQGETLWEAERKTNPDLQCANLFWRYATHATSQVNVAERPTYWASGRKGEDIYTEPGSVRDELVEKLGSFPLFQFWGPAAGAESTKWITEATTHMMETRKLDMLLTYLPHLDYDHQRFGPEGETGVKALQEVDIHAGKLIRFAEYRNWNIAVVSDYAFEKVSKPVFLNRLLREWGLITVQRAENGELLEPGASRAFAVCDQQIAHIYVSSEADHAKVRDILTNAYGVDRIYDRHEMQELGVAHERAGEFLVIAKADHWFAYPYWLNAEDAPDFANCVAIHAKPGWDPAELFLAPGLAGKLHLAKRIAQSKLGIRAPFDVISTDATVVGGAHGRIPTTDETRPLLITNWKHDSTTGLPMQNIKSMLLARP